MIMQDKMEKERADSKNAVEEYVYEMRDKLSGALSEFMTEAVSILCVIELIRSHLSYFILTLCVSAISGRH